MGKKGCVLCKEEVKRGETFLVEILSLRTGEVIGRVVVCEVCAERLESYGWKLRRKEDERSKV